MKLNRLTRVLLLCPLLLLLLQTSVLAQNKTVTGTVLDDKGAPVQGASVLVKGTTIGTQTDAAGTFSLNVPASASALTVSYVGYATQEISIVNQTTVTITLSGANQTNLNEVVVIGYGAVRKKDVTGAVTTVSAKDFNQGPTTSPQQLIQGKVAGLEVTNSSGQPGAATTIRIRGNSTVRSGNNPLYVVDGVPLDGRIARPGVSVTGLGTTPAIDPLYFFNNNDIGSISILKDASATAIYGSRAANGVVLIETKKGTGGEPKLEVNSTTGISDIMKRYKVLDAGQYRQALKDKGLSTGDYGSDVDALSAILRTGLTQNYNIAMSGGNENGKYRASLSYFDQQGIVKTSDLKRYTAEVSGQFRFLPSKKLTLDFMVLSASNHEQLAPISNDAGASGNLMSAALQWNPTLSLLRPNGTYWTDDIPTGSTNPNPLTLLAFYNDRANVSSIFGYVRGGYKFTDWLSYNITYGVNHQSGERRTSMSDSINYPDVKGKGFAAVGGSFLNTQIVTNTLNFIKQVSSSVNINAVLGYEYQSFGFRGNSITASTFSTIPILDYADILQNSAAGQYNISAYNDPKSYLQSYFARAIINYKEKYLLTATIRSDGSSKFGSNNRYGYFPSFAAGWDIAQEDFMKGSSVFTQLKLRGGWGITGNQEFPAGAAQTQFAYAQGTIAQSNVANPDLKWEQTKQTNIGLDFAILKNVISGSVDYFHKNTSNLLFNFQAIQPAPATRYWINLPGEILNSGVEVNLNATIAQTKSLLWSANGNVTFLHNELKNYVGPTVLTGAVSGQGVSGAFVQKLINNQPLNVFYTRKFTGFDQSGFSTYQDGADASFIVGNPNPKVLAGFSTSVTVNKFYFGINLTGAFGHVIYNNTLNSVLNMGNLGKLNIAESLLGTNEVPSNGNSPSSRFLEKGDYVKFSNATISYTVGNLGNVVKNLRVAVTGQNLFYITKFSGFSPEVNTDKSNNGVSSYGMEYIPYPTARTIQLGVNFSL